MKLYFGYKEIIQFIGIFFFCYLTFYLGFQQENIKKFSLELVHSTANMAINHFYDNTLVKVLPMKRGNTDISFEGSKLSINNLDYNPDYDSRIIMINEKILKMQIQNAKQTEGSKPNLQIQSFKFSMWNFVLLPITILLSLIIAHSSIFKFSLMANIYAIILTLLMIILQTTVILTNFRSQALNLEKLEINEYIIYWLSKMHNLFHIEFTFVTVMIVYLFVFWKLIFNSIYRPQIAE